MNIVGTGNLRPCQRTAIKNDKYANGSRHVAAYAWGCSAGHYSETASNLCTKSAVVLAVYLRIKRAR